MKKMGIVGAGVMGIGIAQSFAQHKYEIILIDISEKILIKAKEKIISNLRFHKMFNKSSEAIDIEEIISRITFTTEYDQLKQVDFVIENVPEKMNIKTEVYKKIDKVCKEECIFLVNTSCISITQIASLTNRVDKVIGTHFMNPVPLKNTVETIKGYYTSENTIKSTIELLDSIGKEVIIVNDLPGFVSNRISHLLMNEAAYVVQDNVASPEQVDTIFKKCFEHKMGPLETADLIGLDTVVNSLDILYESYHDSKFRVCPLLRKMVDAKLYGVKSGKGFYEYL